MFFHAQKEGKKFSNVNREKKPLSKTKDSRKVKKRKDNFFPAMPLYYFHITHKTLILKVFAHLCRGHVSEPGRKPRHLHLPAWLAR